MPEMACFVVNGYEEISSEDKVAALKKVVFPVFVFPIIPSLIGTGSLKFENIYLCLDFQSLIFSNVLDNSLIAQLISSISCLESLSFHFSKMVLAISELL